MAGRAGGWREQQVRAEGNRKQAKTEKKEGGWENKSKTFTTADTIWQQTHAPTMSPKRSGSMEGELQHFHVSVTGVATKMRVS